MSFQKDHVLIESRLKSTFHPSLVTVSFNSDSTPRAHFPMPAHRSRLTLLSPFLFQKTGRWNAMHVRVAWEIYHHQAKQNPEKASSVAGVKPDNMLRPHMYPPPASPSVPRPHEMTPAPPPGFPNPSAMPGRPFDPLGANFLTSPSSHLGLSAQSSQMQNNPNMNGFQILGVSPFGRYASPFASPFSGMSPYVRDMPMGGPILDPWRR